MFSVFASLRTKWLLWCVLMCSRVCSPVCHSGVWFACWTLLALSRTSTTQPGPNSTTWQVILAAWTWPQCSSTPCFVCFLFLVQHLIFNILLIDQKSRLLSMYLLLWAAHTPDNTFLGFVVQHQLSSEERRQLESTKRQNQALVYGKRATFWKVTILRDLNSLHLFLV